jgi:hypothetical protein
MDKGPMHQFLKINTFKQKNTAAELGGNLLTHKNLCENKLYVRELLYNVYKIVLSSDLPRNIDIHTSTVSTYKQF